MNKGSNFIRALNPVTKKQAIATGGQDGLHITCLCKVFE